MTFVANGSARMQARKHTGTHPTCSDLSQTLWKPRGPQRLLQDFNSLEPLQRTALQRCAVTFLKYALTFLEEAHMLNISDTARSISGNSLIEFLAGCSLRNEGVCVTLSRISKNKSPYRLWVVAQMNMAKRWISETASIAKKSCTYKNRGMLTRLLISTAALKWKQKHVYYKSLSAFQHECRLRTWPLRKNEATYLELKMLRSALSRD